MMDHIDRGTLPPEYIWIEIGSQPWEMDMEDTALRHIRISDQDETLCGVPSSGEEGSDVIPGLVRSDYVISREEVPMDSLCAKCLENYQDSFYDGKFLGYGDLL